MTKQGKGIKEKVPFKHIVNPTFSFTMETFYVYLFPWNGESIGSLGAWRTLGAWRASISPGTWGPLKYMRKKREREGCNTFQ